MRWVFHLLGGLFLLVLTAATWLKARKIDQDTTTKWSASLIRFVTLGEVRTQRDWVTRLRLVYITFGFLALVIAVLLFVSA
jgi:hypothetical protein